MINQSVLVWISFKSWIPAFAGMTSLFACHPGESRGSVAGDHRTYVYSIMDRFITWLAGDHYILGLLGTVTKDVVLGLLLHEYADHGDKPEEP